MAAIYMQFPGGKSKALTLSYDDGVEQDRQLIPILDRYGLKATFNLNSGCYAAEGTVYPTGQIHRRMTASQVSELYGSGGHEVAVHTLTHPHLEYLPSHLVLEELLQDRKNLEEQFHRIVRGMAYPYGTYNDTIVDCLEMAGFAYSRTVISSHEFNLPRDWLRLEATCHHNDPKLMELAHRFVEGNSQCNPWLFYLWGHSYEFEADNNWNVIEEFARFTGGHEEIWYATNIEIYDYIQAYQRLEFSADSRLVHNPTVTDIYFLKANQSYCVQAGSTVELS